MIHTQYDCTWFILLVFNDCNFHLHFGKFLFVTHYWIGNWDRALRCLKTSKSLGMWYAENTGTSKPNRKYWIYKENMEINFTHIMSSRQHGLITWTEWNSCKNFIERHLKRKFGTNCGYDSLKEYLLDVTKARRQELKGIKIPRKCIGSKLDCPSTLLDSSWEACNPSR